MYTMFFFFFLTPSLAPLFIELGLFGGVRNYFPLGEEKEGSKGLG